MSEIEAYKKLAKLEKAFREGKITEETYKELKAKYSSGLEIKHYYSERWNFSIEYPGNWGIFLENESADPWIIPVAVASEMGRGKTGFIVNVQGREILAKYTVMSVGPDGRMRKQPTNPQEFIEVAKDDLIRSFPNLHFYAEEEIQLLGKPAVKLVYSYDSREGRTKEQSITYFGVGVTFQFICESPESEFENWEPVFEYIINSFRIGRGIVETPSKLPSLKEMSPVELYNAGASLYKEAKYEKAKEYFKRCYQAGMYRMQAAYAMALCDVQLGRKPEIPKELRGQEDETGAVYVSSNLACYLIEEGHTATLKRVAKGSEVHARIKGIRYIIRTSTDPLTGGFVHFVFRQKGEEEIEIYPFSRVTLIETDRYLISLVKNASSLPLCPLPVDGLKTMEES